MTGAQRVAALVVRGYQLLLGPIAGGACRFHPTCSAYALEAIETHGVARGLVLSVKRVMRCHPFGAAGVDPVPPRPADSDSRVSL